MKSSTRTRILAGVLVSVATTPTVALTVQQQETAAFNDKNNDFVYDTHNHLKCNNPPNPPTGSECQTNSLFTYNNEDGHTNSNYNGNREVLEKVNEHGKPAADNNDELK
jgi:hypothetical protein